MVEEGINKAEKLLNEGKLQEALCEINVFLKTDPFDIEGLLLRAKIYYRLQKWGDVLNDLNLIVDKDQDNQTAKNYKTMVLDILTYWNKDNYNP